MVASNIFSNFAGVTRDTFSILFRGKTVLLGHITKAGVLQGMDDDGRIVRDLVPFNPKWSLDAEHAQTVTRGELHDLSALGVLELHSGASYTVDSGGVLVL